MSGARAGGKGSGAIPGWHGGSPAAAPRPHVHASGPTLGRTVLRPLIGQATRGTLFRRRSLLVVILGLAPVLVAVLLGTSAVETPDTIARVLFTTLELPVVIPIAALVLGTGALGSEIEDGTVIHLLARPVGRGWIIVAKAIVAAGGAAGLAAVSTLLTALVLTGFGSLGLVLALTIGGAIGAATYAIVFVAVSAWTTRALVVGLGYVLLWEAVITSLFPGTRLLSIRVYAEGIAAGMAGRDAGELGTDVPIVPALVLVAVVVGLALRLGTTRLRRHEISDGG